VISVPTALSTQTSGMLTIVLSVMNGRRFSVVIPTAIFVLAALVVHVMLLVRKSPR
jgi:hypothetical protein